MKATFDAIVITSASAVQAQAYTLELELRRRIGVIPEETLIVAVPDPAGLRVGSGGATLNALTVVSARLCFLAGYSEINPQYLQSKRILILHSGGDSQRIPIFSVRGKAFSSLPSTDPTQQYVRAPIDFLISKLSSIFAQAPLGGCVVAATDVLLLMPDTYEWKIGCEEGVTGIGVTADKDVGVGHGVYVCEGLDANNIFQEPVIDILQKASVAQLQQVGAVRNDGSIIIDSGIIFFSSQATADLLSLHSTPPLDSCTDIGLDGGNIPLRFELYTDILLVMNPKLTREQYIALPPPAKDSDPDRLLRARKLLWRLFRKYTFFLSYSSNSHFAHLGTVQEYLSYLNNDSIFRKPFGLEKAARVFIEYPQFCKQGVLINSILVGHGHVDNGALVENSFLRGNFHIESNSIVSGIRSISGLHSKSLMVIQEVQLSASRVRADPRISHLLSSQHERQSREQPFFISPSNDRDRFGLDDESSTKNDPVLRVIIVFGVMDQIKESYNSKHGTLCNRPWSHYFPPSSMKSENNMENKIQSSLHSFAHLLINPDDDDIWPASTSESNRTLWNARLFPILVGESTSESILWLQYDEAPSVQTLCEWKQSTRVSLQDILSLADAPKEFYWRARASFLVDEKEIESTLLERHDRPILPILSRCEPVYKRELISCLDNIASSGPLDICARSLCTLADLLATLPGTHMYTRSGPARNPQWLEALTTLANARTAHEQAKGVSQLAKIRDQWLKVGSPQLYMRAARHYDAAWASLTRKGVETVKAGITVRNDKPAIAIGDIAHVTSPVRIDLMGGWSDTPPITFEHGGKVVNVAITLNDAHPIGVSAKAFNIDPHHTEKVIIIRTGSIDKEALDETKVTDEDDDDDNTVILTKVSDLSDYNDPLAPAALVKCVLLALGVVDLNSSVPLAQQIKKTINPNATPSATPGIGLYIRSWSNLPQGTGLGVSSILAANIVVAVGAVVGRNYDLNTLMLVVLLVEQMLTTGGGWQDQIGGCFPGFKIGSSADSLPLQLKVQPIEVKQDFINSINNHIAVIHTGQSRLAKNLLQTVLRRWYQRDEVVTRVMDGLVDDSEKMKDAISHGNIPLIGTLMQKYWEYKKIMGTPPPVHLKQAKEAPVEPVHIQRLSARLRPHVHGLTLAGAGGGGVMCIITKVPLSQSRSIIEGVLQDINNERQLASEKSLVDSEEAQEFADEWPTGNYVLYGASVCQKGLSINIVKSNSS